MNQLVEKAKKIKCVICDVDGVLTNGVLYLDNQNNEIKAFHIHDGMGLKLLMCAGIEVAIITTSRNAVIGHRMKQLGIQHFFTGQVDKRKAYQTLKNTLQLNDEAFAYIGDDLPDIAILRQVGLSVAVANAQDLVKEVAVYQTNASGGQGAVREVCDFILNTQNKLNIALDNYLTMDLPL